MMNELHFWIRLFLFLVAVWGTLSAIGLQVFSTERRHVSQARIGNENHPVSFPQNAPIIDRHSFPLRMVMINPFQSDEDIERLVFSSANNVRPRRGQIDEEIKSIVEIIDRCCQLTEAQIQKLQLAARADRKKIIDRIEQLRNDFRNEVRPLEEILSDITQLRDKVFGTIFDSSSFLAKSLRLILTEDQYARLTESKRDRFRQFAEDSLNEIEVHVLLTSSEREILIQMLDDLASSGVSVVGPDILGQNFDRVFMLSSLWPHSEDRVKPFLEPEKWEQFEPLLHKYHEFYHARALSLVFGQDRVLVGIPVIRTR